MDSYASVLESYIITEPAEEGFAGTVLKILGYSVTALAALPMVALGGFLFVGGISVAIEARKLRRMIRKNKGEYSDYGRASYEILKSYSNSITGVNEPKNLYKYIQLNVKAFNVLKEACAAREEFNKLDPNNFEFYDSCKRLTTKLEAIKKKADSIPIVSDEDIRGLKSGEYVTVPLHSSNIMKLSLLDKEVWNFISDGYDNDDEYCFFSDARPELYDDIKIWGTPAESCVDCFQHIMKTITDVVDSTRYIETCKFAVHPKAKRNK